MQNRTYNPDARSRRFEVGVTLFLAAVSATAALSLLLSEPTSVDRNLGSDPRDLIPTPVHEFEREPVEPTTIPAPIQRGAAPEMPTAPCATEDSDDCYWDASAFGNGQGRSFWALADGTVIYRDR